jgi:hypothetical protein
MPAPGPNTYPFDSTGSAPSNRIEDEIHTLSQLNFRDYNCIVPDFAPFFADTVQVHFRTDDSSPWLTMNEGVDWFPAFQFIGATRQTALPIYGGIVFSNLMLQGEIRLSYNTVGGEWTLDQEKLTEILINLIYNPRTTTWEQVSGAPAHFPPATHAWNLDDMVGMSEVVTALEAIEDAILNADQNGDLLSHITDFNNPHRTNKGHVGLSRVMNYPPATIAETIDGSNSELYVTPTGLHAYIQSLGLDAALNFVTLEEVVNRISVNKILTFDLFLLYMRLYGGGETAPVDNNTERPTILIPIEGGDYSVDQFFTCNTFFASDPGSITRTITLSGTGSHNIPQGVNSVRVTGRGAVGGSSIQPYVTVTENVSGLGSGSFVIPAGGSIMSIRARGAAGTQSNTAGIYTPVGLGQLNNVPAANPAPGNPSWSFSIVSAFAVGFQMNGQQPTLQVNLVIRKTYTNGVVHTADPLLVNLTLASANFSGSELTYTGSFNVTFADLTELTAIYEANFNRLPGTDIIPGASATVSVNGAVRTYSGSSTLAQPNLQSNDIAIVSSELTSVSYNSPPGTEVEIIYQDYSANGTWAVRRYYSSILTNPGSGTSALVEDTDGSIVGLDSNVTGQWLSTRTNVSTVATAAIPGTYQLNVLPGSSNATVRLFEINFVVSGVPATIRVVAEFTSNLGVVTAGQPALVSLLGNSLVYPGSADNQTIPQVRTDTIVLNTSFSTAVTYDCPTGSSVVLVYNEPSATQPITHASTTWEVATSELFEEDEIIDSRIGSIGLNASLTQWRPEDPDIYVNNTTYFVRCKWIRSDGGESDWSDSRAFRFIAAVSYPPRDTELSRYCRGVDLWGIFATGDGGSYERLITSQSPTCGYVPPAANRPITATGGEISNSGCFRIHTFRDSGVFSVTDSGTIGSVIEYIIVAGGGPGGIAAGNNSTGTGAGACGGGGGGDVIIGNATVTVNNYQVVIGAGGTHPNNGGNSSFNGVIAIGGGRGGAYNGNHVTPTSGGSGGGAGQGGIGSTRVGAGSSSGLGYKGGDVFIPSPQATGGGGGGGGAGGPGQDAQRRGQPSPIHGGNGGIGVSSSISGQARLYGAGGGGGGANASSVNGEPTPRGDAGIGGNGIGGNGARFRGEAATAGAANTGSGGGGGSGAERPGARGGSGIVIIRYNTCVEN